MKNTTKLLLSLILIAGGLIISRIIISSSFSVDGIALSQMNQEIATLDKNNMMLSEKIYSLSSFATIANTANDEGFVEEKYQIALQNTSSLAIKQ